MWLDAHNHLHDSRLTPLRPRILADLAGMGSPRMVVNGTAPEDWPQVAALAQQFDFVLPAFGLHPWFVQKAAPDWRDQLRALLKAHPAAGVGEIGLDRWIHPHDLPAQIDAFTFQLALASELARPVSIHCLKAWGALWDIIREHPLPTRGFLLHSYGGPREMIEGFCKRGAYFSFSPYFLHPRKASQRDLFKHVPIDRLLVESDAPDMWPPDAINPHLLNAENGDRLNHPANIEIAYNGLAETVGLSLAELTEQVAENFRRLFDPSRGSL